MLARLSLRCPPRRHHRLSWRGWPDSELSVRCTPLRYAADRDQPRGLAAALDSVLLPETSETGGEDARCARALVCWGGGRPPRWSALCSSGGHEAPPSPTVLAALRAWDDGLRGQSPDTRAVMPKAALLPAPAAQDPRHQVPAVSSRERSTARFIGHNSALCPRTRCAVTALAAPTSRSSGHGASTAPAHRRILPARRTATARFLLNREVALGRRTGLEASHKDKPQDTTCDGRSYGVLSHPAAH